MARSTPNRSARELLVSPRLDMRRVSTQARWAGSMMGTRLSASVAFWRPLPFALTVMLRSSIELRRFRQRASPGQHTPVGRLRAREIVTLLQELGHGRCKARG